MEVPCHRLRGWLSEGDPKPARAPRDGEKASTSAPTGFAGLPGDEAPWPPFHGQDSPGRPGDDATRDRFAARHGSLCDGGGPP